MGRGLIYKARRAFMLDCLPNYVRLLNFQDLARMNVRYPCVTLKTANLSYQFLELLELLAVVLLRPRN